MQNELNIAMLQMDQAWENRQENMAKGRHYFDLLPADTDLWILPEMFTSGFTNNVKEMAETMKGESITLFKRWAHEKDLAICCSLIIEEEGNYYNRFVFVKPSGTVEYYNKAHLFPFGLEDKHYTCGNERIIITYKGWRILPQICYDLRFPVWSRNDLDYDLCIYVANWPALRNHVWHTLLMARAIENMCYVVGVNRVGLDANKIHYVGQSLISDAKGTILNKISDHETQILHQINLEKLQHFREKFPVLQDRDAFELKRIDKK